MGCEPDIGVSFPRRVESSLGSAGFCRVHYRVTYSRKNVSLAVIIVRSPSVVQNNLTMRRYE